MWNDLKDYSYPVLEDGDVLAFFKSKEDAQAFLEWKVGQPNPNKNDYTVGEYVDTDINIQIQGS